MNRITFRSAHVGETRKLTFDFISDLALGETLSTAVASFSVYSGDADAEVAFGSPVISGTQVVVTAAGDTEGVTFMVTITVVTSAGQTLMQSGFFAMTPEGL